MSKVDPDEIRELIERLEALVALAPSADLMERFINAVNQCPDADTINRLARGVREYRDIS